MEKFLIAFSMLILLMNSVILLMVILMNFREAQLEDTDILDNLLTKLINDERQNYDDAIRPDFKVKDFYKNCLGHDNKKIYLCEDNSNIIGYIYLYIDNDMVGIIDALFVEENYRGKGIASLLIDLAFKWFKDNDIKTKEISVMKDNNIARNLYINRGFKVIKETLRLTDRDILFATGNVTKGKRFSSGLAKYNINVLTLKDLDIELDVVEDGKNPIDNALIKARAGFKETHMPTMGMDDSLYLEGLPDYLQPGLYVRRVNGKTLTDEEMIEHYTDLVKKYGHDGKINCKWIYGLAVIDEDGNEYTYSWEKGGIYMVDVPSKVINPGYPLNSISKYEDNNKYFSEIKREEKLNEDNVINFIVNSIYHK